MNHTSMRLKKARTRLLLTTDSNLVFLAHLLVVQDKEDSTVETACTDGTVIRWNPEFVASCSDAELFGVLLHELMHIALLHVVVAAGIPDRDFDLMNVAADLAVNSILKACGQSLPEGGCFPGEGEFSELEPMKSMEWYMAALRKMESVPKCRPFGDIEAAGSEAKRNGDSIAAELAAENIRIVAKKAAAASRGSRTSKVVQDALAVAVESKIDFRVLLRKFRSKITKGGSDWNRLNRRLGVVGVSAPTNRRKTVGNVCILLDVSGSIESQTLSQSLRETVEIFDQIAGDIVIVQHDVEVQSVCVWKRGESMPEIARAADGGTSHVEPFESIAKMNRKFDCIVAFTDLHTEFPTQAPKTPVIWAITEDGSRKKPPFGIVAKNCL